jgi:hypothetical protein
LYADKDEEERKAGGRAFQVSTLLKKETDKSRCVALIGFSRKGSRFDLERASDE